MHEHPVFNQENQDPEWKKAVIVLNSNYARWNEIETFYKECSIVELVDWCWLMYFIAWGASHLLLLHIENYHKPSSQFHKQITMPDCRCTNKESCLVRNSSTSKWKCFICTLTKQTINYPSPNSWQCSRALWYGCALWFSWTMTWEHGCPFSPAQYYCWLIAHYSLSHNKMPAQDILEISTTHLPPKRIGAEKWCWKCFRPHWWQ